MDKAWREVLSELFVDLAAGYFAAALIVPSFSDVEFTYNLWILILDIFFGILFLYLAYKLKKALK